ncbi:uncharacterized protein [Diadema antillarum]|uniref:uncharacterized protein n=1 Tax=Diadema antillarum TaxID=105358 RepID=UPI003A851A12
MSHLEKSEVVWHCHKCNSANIDSFTFHSYELEESNIYFPLTNLKDSLDTLSSNEPFSPTFASSPRKQRNFRKRSQRTSTPSPTSGVTAPSRETTARRSTPSESLPDSERPSTTSGSSLEGENSRTFLRNTGNLRLLTVNCCSLRGKTAEFKAALQYVNPDIICGTESWLQGIKPGLDPGKDAIKNSEVFPSSYQIYRNDRDGCGGGVFIGVQQEVMCSELPNAVTECEINWTKIQLPRSAEAYFGVFYMPHRSLLDVKRLDESLKKFQGKENKTIVIAGDFNCPDIDWQTLTLRHNAQDREVQQALIDLSLEHGLVQIHNQATRYDNILDIVLTNNPTQVKSSYSIPGISDHAMVVTDFDMKPAIAKIPRRKIYKYSQADWEEVKKDVANISQMVIERKRQGTNVQDLWTMLRDSLLDIIEQRIPSKSSSSRQSLPWFNHKLKRMVKRKARLYRRAKKTNSWADYKAFQRQCRQEFRRAERDHLTSTIVDELEINKNSKPFWSYIKAKRKDRNGVPPLMLEGNLVKDSRTKATTLLQQFTSVFTRDQTNRMPSIEKSYNCSLPPLQITADGVLKLLQNINIHKACGPDNIPTIILKQCATELAPALSEIFQLSLDTGVLPTDWLQANVTPVFKTGDVHQSANYRPISKTSVTCKLLEHIICKHLLDYLEENNILTHLNHGFRSGYSTETQLITALHDLLHANDQRKQSDIIVLDLSKAFDKVPHENLLHKLTSIGITGPTHSWLRNFLTKRCMRVVIDGESSHDAHVDSGVPQGTVLGPLLFLCYINDLPDTVRSQIRLFADDCLLYRQIRNQEDHLILQNDLTALVSWAHKWGMCFNAEKCYTMSVCSKSSYFYQLNSHILQHVHDIRYLGVTISDDLKWEKHVAKTTQKANWVLSLLRRNLYFCPANVKRTAYTSLVRSLLGLEYGATAWDPYLQKDINRLESVQRRAVRFITGDYVSRDDGFITNKLAELCLPSLKERRRNLKLTLFFKVVGGAGASSPNSNLCST